MSSLHPTLARGRETYDIYNFDEIGSSDMDSSDDEQCVDSMEVELKRSFAAGSV